MSLFHSTTTKLSGTTQMLTKILAAANSGFAIAEGPCFADTLVQGGSSVLRMKFSAKTSAIAPPETLCAIQYKRLNISRMKHNTVLLLTIVLLTAKSLTAQINIPSDSIKTTLCHKWDFKAIIMARQRLTNMNESVTYEFISDGTFKRVSSNGKAENGTWIYMPDQKIVLLKIKKTALHIPSLSSTELIVSPGDGVNETKNGLGIGTVLKPAENN